MERLSGTRSIQGGAPCRVNPQGMERMLTEYYRIRGWDEKGVPTKKRLEALRLA